MSNYAFILDSNKNPWQPCHPSVARKLLYKGKAAVFRRYPFTIILKEVKTNIVSQPIELKIDPGSKTTGIALVCNSQVVWGGELTHRGFQIKDKLQSRANCRRGRRNRNTRYRKPRFLDPSRAQDTRAKGWLTPSLQHRVLTTMTWVKRLCKYAPINSFAEELVRFDTQQIDNPEITGTEYQQGTLLGYEVREYLLEKWGRSCTYCDKKDTPLEIEHIVPRASGGSNRISNLCLACHSCNTKKGTRSIEEFLKKKPDLLNRIKKQAKAPLRDAAAVNSARWDLYNQLKKTGLPVAVASGGKTKYNRIRLGLTKTHWLDAACVGEVASLKVLTKKPLLIKARGQGGRQKCAVNKFGYPIRHNPLKPIMGWQTGDIARFNGVVGRLTTRSNGRFYLTTATKTVTNLKPKEVALIKPVQRKDGYEYTG